MEKMIASDCEGTKNGYRCWAAGEQGFKDAAQGAAKEWFEHLIEIEAKTHRKHHDYIDSEIEKNARDAERWEKIKTQVLGWGVIAIVGWLGTIALKAIENWRGHP